MDAITQAHIPEAFYLVLDFGKRGRETIIDWERCSKSDIIDDIIKGDYGGKLIEVGCIDRSAGRWWDVSEDIAREVLDKLDTDPQGDLFEFLERQLGCEHMAQFFREAAE